ncbi:unnamed protein product [Cuscuta epithymum]|uniref:Uncharacterized protein n=1 Tax=Cuscuta epithymum TaxID=186058 RepID=A0AAV0ECL1_9ASTE|nr:unnamed protein product [Cuscuta epithymum]
MKMESFSSKRLHQFPDRSLGMESINQFILWRSRSIANEIPCLISDIRIALESNILKEKVLISIENSNPFTCLLRCKPLCLEKDVASPDRALGLSSF